MPTNPKKERFDKITAARIGKLENMLRLIGNCSDKNNYSYTDEDVQALFSAIDKSVDEAKNRYKLFSADQSTSKARGYAYENDLTWAEGFRRNVLKYPERTALICPETGREWSYSELNSEVNRLANAMRAAGVGYGDKVMYSLDNCPEFAFVYAACHKIGAVGCPLHKNLAPARTAAAISSVMPKLFFYENSGDTELALTMTKCKPQLVVVNLGEDKRPLDGHISYSGFTTGFLTDEPTQEPEKTVRDTTTLFFTSGTTGRQKCVPVTDTNEVMSVYDMMIYLGLSSDDTVLTLSPWSHRGGLHCGGPAAALYAGAAIVAADVSEPTRIIEYAEKYRVTLISGMPSDFDVLAREQLIANRNLAALKRIISVGASFSAEDCMRWRRTLCPNVYNGYGTTETFWNTILTPERAVFSPCSAGEVCVGDEVRIVRTYNDRDAEPDDTVPKDNRTKGEIIIKSVSKSTGTYFDDADGDSRYYKGFLYTKDVGVWDEDGIITVVGRNDDMITCNGESVYPEEIEEILMKNPKVADCIVTSALDGGSELIAAYIVKADRSLSVGELDKYCRSSRLLPDSKRPRLYRFKRKLPYTPNGKKQHNRARRLAASDLKNNMFARVD